MTDAGECLFSEQEMALLEALLDRIIPADDYPGAWDAGCGDYICRLLVTESPHLLPLYRLGLASLDQEAQARFSCPFTALAAGRQDKLLQLIEQGKVLALWPVEPRQFFTTVVHHTAEGYYSDPANGGNRDALSWAMIGF